MKSLNTSQTLNYTGQQQFSKYIWKFHWGQQNVNDSAELNQIHSHKNEAFLQFEVICRLELVFFYSVNIPKAKSFCLCMKRTVT